MSEPKVYISELKVQLEVIDDELRKIRNRGYSDVWGIKIRAEDKPEFDALLARRRVIVKRIINHDSKWQSPNFSTSRCYSEPAETKPVLLLPSGSLSPKNPPSTTK